MRRPVFWSNCWVESMAKPKAGKWGCHGTTKRGTLCDAKPLKAGTEIEGVKVKGKHCRAHDPDLPASARFGSRAQAKEAAKHGGRPPLPRPTDIARRLIEQNELALQRPYWRTLGYDVVLGKDGLELVVLPDGGAKMHGESKEGDIVASPYEDLGAQQEAAERLWNRVYGKPKQTQEITGADGGPVEIVPVTRAKARKVDGILAGVGAGKGGG
jgi:hypothetical protein